ncbi:hypothetical protein NLG97_g11133 [Lecanicillium saksenae]|uniref:Uncharacterized protein n=1 Tax=Lecanicillium saksenae TaxID=468837 RepID=A0ACC1QCK2_9HYPO|nr:hypothetical protein NLG97_g11133 [Lecanicillium saksenae]
MKVIVAQTAATRENLGKTNNRAELMNRFQDIQFEEADRIQQAGRPTDEASKWAFNHSGSSSSKSPMDRYSNIRPWNHNRVKLNVPDGAPDYVNASPIAVPASNDEAPTYKYVAMQGPTVPSFDSVWRMVAENTTSVAVVVQLTTMIEGEQVKCSQYFPFSDEDKTWELNADDAWGDGWTATLTYESTEQLCDGAIERRKFLLHVGGEEEPRTVWHFLYLRWPDFGVPALTDVQSFFELMKMSREHATEVEEPRFVHCSAGVGRTGTFICLEHLMRELEMGGLDALDANDPDADPVYETVDALRQQRRLMVQSQPQYMFIYQVMRKLWGEKYGMSDDDMARGGGSGGGTGGGQPSLKRFEMADPTWDESASNSSFVSEGGSQGQEQS